jgi:uncharacterized protein (DUF433 family)
MDVSTEHIEIVEGAFGPKPHIRGTRIRVEDVVVWYERQGMSVSEIVEGFPHITRADVHAALAYYWDHKDELDRVWGEADAWVEEHRRTYTSPFQEALKRQRVGPA